MADTNENVANLSTNLLQSLLRVAHATRSVRSGMPDIPERTALYRLYDADGTLLYVGIAKRPERRWRQHAVESLWWRDVNRKAVEWHDTRRAAEQAEKVAIRTEGPCYNTAHSPSPSGLKPGWRAAAPAPSARTAAERRALNQRGQLFSLQSRNAKVSMPELVARKIREWILSGRYPVGTQLPTVADLAHEFGISRPTVSRGLQVLFNEGVVEHCPGRGTFVLSVPTQ